MEASQPGPLREQGWGSPPPKHLPLFTPAPHRGRCLRLAQVGAAQAPSCQSLTRTLRLCKASDHRLGSAAEVFQAKNSWQYPSGRAQVPQVLLQQGTGTAAGVPRLKFRKRSALQSWFLLSRAVLPPNRLSGWEHEHGRIYSPPLHAMHPQWALFQLRLAAGTLGLSVGASRAFCHGGWGGSRRWVPCGQQQLASCEVGTRAPNPPAQSSAMRAP